MSRSFIAGSVSGVALSVFGLSAVSLMAPPLTVDRADGQQATMAQPAADAPDTAIIDVPAGSEFSKPKTDSAATVPDADETVSAEGAPAVTAPAAEEAATVQTAPAAAPAAPEAPTEAKAAATDSQSVPVDAPVVDAPVAAPSEGSPELAQPTPNDESAGTRVSGAGTAGGLVLSEAGATTEPSALATPTPSQDAAPMAEAVPEPAPTTVAKPAPAAVAPSPAPATAVTQPVPEPATEAAPAAEPSAATPDVATGTESSAPQMTPAPSASAPAAPATGGAGTETGTSDGSSGTATAPDSQDPGALPSTGGDESVPTPEMDSDQPEPADVPSPDEGAAPGDGSSAGDGTAPAGEATPGAAPEPVKPKPFEPKFVKVTPRAGSGTTDTATTESQLTPSGEEPVRITTMPGTKAESLPTISSDETTLVTVPNSETQGVSLITVPNPAAESAAGALDKFAAKFSNPDNKPLLAVVILDKGVAAGGLDAAALAGMPFAVTIAIDPEREDATTVEATYRIAGDEVAVMISKLPEGSTPSDLEVIYQSFTQALPESMALIAAPDSAALSNSMTAQHFAALLKADGRGLITYSKGLNAGKRAAEKSGVPQAEIGKLFGPTEDNSGTFGRELDRAAFDAGREGTAVVAIPSTPEAITALMAWAAGPSASGVVLAPVSAVMLKGK